jgi:hypothetical protein
MERENKVEQCQLQERNMFQESEDQRAARVVGLKLMAQTAEVAIGNRAVISLGIGEAEKADAVEARCEIQDSGKRVLYAENDMLEGAGLTGPEVETRENLWELVLTWRQATDALARLRVIEVREFFGVE